MDKPLWMRLYIAAFVLFVLAAAVVENHWFVQRVGNSRI